MLWHDCHVSYVSPKEAQAIGEAGHGSSGLDLYEQERMLIPGDDIGEGTEMGASCLIALLS